MYRRSSRHATIPCARCGRAAAELSLLPASFGNDPRTLRDRLERTDFLDHICKTGKYEDLLKLFEAVVHCNWERARELEPDMVAFVCRVCDTAYCDECWTASLADSDEDFYECMWGSCPHAHVQIISD